MEDQKLEKVTGAEGQEIEMKQQRLAMQHEEF